MINWKPKAVTDLQTIMSYIAQDNPKAAVEVIDAILGKVDLLENNPHLGRTGRVKNTRELVALKNYIVIYRLVDDVAQILRIKHAAQQWP